MLNAKQHEREAHVVAQAGRLGSVTIATNMAGRGTDILLGGNPDGLVEELLAQQGIKLEEATPEQEKAAREEAKRLTEVERDRGCRSSVACTSSAPNGTRRAGSTTSCVVAPAARATPARRAFTFRWKMT